MPLVRIDLLEGKSAEFCAQVGDVVYRAMVQEMRVPEGDRFQIVTQHPASGLSCDKTYLNIERSGDCILIQVTLNAGRSTEVKQRFYQAVADGLHASLSIRKEDVLISLVEVQKENWSFGNGVAQYV